MALDITGLGSLADLVGKVVDRVWPDATRAAEIKLELFKAEQAGALQELTNAWDNAKAQLEVNRAEAGTGNLFIAGWRPFIGWVCGFAFAYKYIAEPILVFGFAVAGKTIDLPAIDFAAMSSILMGMLGLGAMRSYEKIKGVNVRG